MQEEQDEGKADAKNQGYRSLSIPVSHEVHISSSSKTISSISLDPSNSRMTVGSLDNSVRMYNFAGMDSSHRPFRDVTPDDGNPIQSIASSGDGEKVLVCTASSSPRILDRNAKEVIQFVKGDVYINDVTNTKGHTASVTGGMVS